MSDPILLTGQQQISLLSLTDYMPSIWSDPDQVRMGARKSINRIEPIRSAYIWDMHHIAEGLAGTYNGYGTVSNLDNNWWPLFAERFDDDAGSRIFSTLDTPFTTAPFTHQTSDKFSYSCSISTHPMMPLEGGVSAALGSESLIWAAALNPGMPFIVGSSIPSALHYGPLFAESINFSVSGQGNLSPVTCNIKMTGGRCILSPPVSRDVFSNSYSFAYRTATLADCGVASEAVFGIEALRGVMNYSWDGASERLIGMSLDITQGVKVTATCNDGTFTDLQGPRYAAIKGRQVSGRLEFYSRYSELNFAVRENGLSSSLTMYFGGTYLFVMENVDWQLPKLNVVAGKGYIHTLEFIARAAPNAVSLVIPGFDVGTASEFSPTPL